MQNAWRAEHLCRALYRSTSQNEGYGSEEEDEYVCLGCGDEDEETCDFFRIDSDRIIPTLKQMWHNYANSTEFETSVSEHARKQLRQFHPGKSMVPDLICLCSMCHEFLLSKGMVIGM